MDSTTITFTDADSGDEAVAIVRVAGGTVGLTLSLQQDGDIEVFLPRDDCLALIAALQQAAAEC